MKKLFILLALILALPLFGEKNDKSHSFTEKTLQESQKVFVLPIDHTKKPLLSLSIEIPSEFKSIQSLSEFIKPANRMIEYIPKNENDDNWSEIITVQKFIGNAVCAIKFTDNLKENMLANSQMGKILTNTSSKEKSLEKTHFLMQYIYQGHQEVIGASVFSGPLDAVCVQYTIKITDKMPKDGAINKIETFFKKQIDLISSADLHLY